MTSLPSILAFLGCFTEPSFHRVAFPGFSLEAPQWLGVPEDSEYRKGEAQGSLLAQRVRVSWHDGALTTVEEMPALFRSVSSETPRDVREVEVAGQRATRLDARRRTLVDVSCGKRTVMLDVSGEAAFVERIVTSFDCHPDEALEAWLGEHSLLAVDDPAVLAGWRREEGEPGAYVITNGEITLDFGEIRKLRLVGVETARAQILAAMGPAFLRTRTERIEAYGQQRVFEVGTVVQGGGLVFGVWLCETGDDGLAVTATSALEDQGEALAVLSRVRCSRPGDRPPIAVTGP
jgi:hypothetical protein